MRKLFALGLALVLALLPAAPTLALTESGSHGWSRNVLDLRSGPGEEYEFTGQIPGEVAIKVLRCQRLWCNVDGPGGRGWTRIGGVDFGRDPYGPFNRERFDLTGGSMCFYTGTNYTGSYFCAESGQVIRDLALAGWDNQISSIQVVEGTSAALCRDRFFQSYCERIVESQPVLDPYLRRNLSSIRVY
jgi:hypothetical protein